MNMYRIIMEDEENSSLPFKSTTMTSIGDDLYKVSEHIPTFLSIVLIMSLCGIIITSVGILFMFGIESFILDELCLGSFYLMWLLALGLAYIIIKMYKALRTIPRSLLPIRTKVKLELMPIGSEDIIKEFYNRLIDIFYFKEPKKFENVINKKVKGKKNTHHFDIFDNFRSNASFLILISTSFIIILFLILFDFSYYFGVNDWNILIIITIVLSLFFSIIIFLIYKYFYFNQFIIAKVSKRKLLSKELIKFKNAIEDVLSGKDEPIIAAIVTDEPIDKELIRLVQSTEGKINNKYTITLVQKTPIGFKLIWTG